MSSDEYLYLKATREVDEGRQNAAIWAKSLALCDGDEGKAKYVYVKLRVETVKQAIEANQVSASPSPDMSGADKHLGQHIQRPATRRPESNAHGDRSSTSVANGLASKSDHMDSDVSASMRSDLIERAASEASPRPVTASHAFAFFYGVIALMVVLMCTLPGLFLTKEGAIEVWNALFFDGLISWFLITLIPIAIRFVIINDPLSKKASLIIVIGIWVLASMISAGENMAQGKHMYHGTVGRNLLAFLNYFILTRPTDWAPRGTALYWVWAGIIGMSAWIYMLA